MANNKIKIAVRKFGPFESALQKLWDKYCQASGCTMSAKMVPMDLEDLHTAIIGNEGLKKGDWDIAHVVTDWLLEAWEGGSLTDLQPFIAQNPPEDFPAGWSESLLDMQRFDNAIAGLPFHDGPECFIYRKDLFEDKTERANFQQRYDRELRVPKTWEEFCEVAAFFNRPTDNFYGTVFAGLPDGHNTVFDLSLQIWTRGGTLVDERGQVNINTKAAAAGLDFYRHILRDGNRVHPGTMLYESVQTGMAFARGEAAMMVNWFGFASMCEVIAESSVKGKVDVADIPSAKGHPSASLNVYWLYTIGSGSKHKQVAYDFLRFAINQQSDKLLTMEGGIGCRKSTWRDEDVNQTIPYYHRLEQLHQSAKSLPMVSTWSQIAKIIDEVVLRAIGTDIPSAQLLAEGQRQITALNPN